VGIKLVAEAERGARAAGCEWLHVDFEEHLQPFYFDACGFKPTATAGLVPLRYGRVDGDVACEALGFPRFKLRQDVPVALGDAVGDVNPDRYRDTHQAIGRITPLSNRRQGTLEITVPSPECDAKPPHSPWEGLINPDIIKIATSHVPPEVAPTFVG
jgi:hypothetical protein